MWQGDSGICLGRPVTITTETIAKVLAASLLKEECKALYCHKVSAHLIPKNPWICSEMDSAQLVREE